MSRPQPPGSAGARREARERAFTLLYEADVKGVDAAALLATLPVAPDPFAVELVEGVARHLADIDRAISARATGWTLLRMPALDRAVLRMGAFELRWRPDIPAAVTINEAVELAKRFSTDDSGRYVNGVLAAIAADADADADVAPDGATS